MFVAGGVSRLEQGVVETRELIRVGEVRRGRPSDVEVGGVVDLPGHSVTTAQMSSRGEAEEIAGLREMPPRGECASRNVSLRGLTSSCAAMASEDAYGKK